MKNKESIEFAINKKREKAIQDGLKIRLVKPTCDCCKKPVDNSKDEYGYKNYYFKCGNKLLCEKCMAINTFKENPQLAIILIGYLFAYITFIPIRPLQKIYSRLTICPLDEKFYRLLLKICFFFGRYLKKIWNDYFDKWKNLYICDSDTANMWYEKMEICSKLSSYFFKCSMYWEEKISQSMETNINDYLAKSWVFDVKRITLGLRWLI